MPASCRRPAGYPALEPCFTAAAPAMARRLAALDHLPQSPRLARWDQDWFPRLDAAIAYSLVRERKPRRIVEVGSGHSTRFLAEAIADGGLATELTAIDPAPRADIAQDRCADDRDARAFLRHRRLSPGSRPAISCSSIPAMC